MFAFNENKIYGAKMKQKLDEKAKGLTPVRNGKVAGANPAESTSSHCYTKRDAEWCASAAKSNTIATLDQML